MRSGESSIDRNHEYYRTRFDEIIDKSFIKKVFSPFPALVSKSPFDGHRMWKPYYGGEYNKELYDLIDGVWDHEHCSICDYKILDNHTYWANINLVRLLCDECHDFFKKA